MENWEIAEEIKKLKEERNAIILAHFYTRSSYSRFEQKHVQTKV